ncbi:Formate/nitrite transporter-domain-containing protein [Dunaliella salina]|uniref:Formate/nitrite transporter-domain-containing protein n=1 Tax=Dunaliella salina TaxID=3046 RepID=A0ABQ7HAL5_DUNSA|nr:Formate/nitrite transporter-domain-containing protein [Dunaliella salina]|eukprot:KAF5843887.1 Formate/nitrite transporter-domain-containing protein [Dunaliella salina]
MQAGNKLSLHRGGLDVRTQLHHKQTCAAAQILGKSKSLGPLVSPLRVRNSSQLIPPLVVQSAASTSPAATVQQTNSVHAPGANYNAVASTGAAKAALPAWKILVGGILAGSYIAFGGLLSASLGGTIPGIAASNPGIQKLIMGIVFPLGLMIVTLCGAELFNGNTAVVTTALLEGKTTLPQVLKSFSLTLLGNWIGSVLVALAVASSGIMSANSIPLVIAAAKTSLGFQTTFIRAVLCNWLVCLAVWMASASSSLPGKVIACWMPIFAFVTIGLVGALWCCSLSGCISIKCNSSRMGRVLAWRVALSRVGEKFLLCGCLLCTCFH